MVDVVNTMTVRLNVYHIEDDTGGDSQSNFKVLRQASTLNGLPVDRPSMT